jgi:hypothetical protein
LGVKLLRGTLPYANSIAVIPNDHISAFVSYPSICLITSGAIHYGEPIKVFNFWSFFIVEAKAKSEILTNPLLCKSILSALISLWINWWLCK